ncbi:MAG TPA: asparagine synthase (glutamine-hydrolyzing) [Candidatus Dormibacteraeota bacterium]|nr:asparagine synthase (glutamine-hydrolyzing) [Candidatus Dormibacteraeota bacterium]
MCGICGNVAFSRLSSPEAAHLRVMAMLRSLSHRGPDATREEDTELAVIGATRLAIRGLKDQSNQPIADAESGVIAVCNGEIDNHRELRRWLAERGRPVQQETDVAVIPGLYLELGEAFATRLVGAFAIAVWDSRNRRLTLVRDRAGERPLFYARHENEIIFATEIAALVAPDSLPVNLDREALQKYLQFGIFPSPDTPFGEIRKVAPGELIQFDRGGVRRKSYWRWQIRETAKQPSSLDTFDQAFRTAIGRQTDVDVDFGVFLSGGIDSSLVSAVVRSLHPKRPLKAYTLRFEEQSFDEGRFAAAVAERLEMELVTVQVKPNDVRDGLKSLIRMVGEPLADPAWIPTTLLAQRAAQESKMALVGEGADELFGGYPTYIGAGIAKRFVQLPGWLRFAIRRVVEALPLSEKKVTISFLLKRFVEGACLNGMTRHQLWVSSITPTLLRRLGVAPIELENHNAAGGDLLDQAQRWDLETLLAEGLLTKADRASMSSALELRAPFLDVAVMEFAKSLPVEERVRGFGTKVFLKRYARRYLPDDIINRRKRGLSVPIGSWLRGPLKEWASATLETGRLEQVGIHKPAAMELFFEHCQRKADHARTLWALLVLGEWLNWVATETDCSQMDRGQSGIFADPSRKLAGKALFAPI